MVGRRVDGVVGRRGDARRCGDVNFVIVKCGGNCVVEACLDDDAVGDGGSGHEWEDWELRSRAATTGEG